MKKTIFLLLAIICAYSGNSESANMKSKKDFGLVSFTFRNSFAKDVATTLDTIRSLGFTNVEFSNLFGRTASEIRELLDERGMKCTSHGVSFDSFCNNIDEVGTAAQTLGAKYVNVAWIPYEGDFSIDLAKKMVAEFNKGGKILKEKYGISFTYHNHGYEFVPYKNGTLLDYIFENTDPEYVNFEIDVVWTYSFGVKPEDLINKYPTRFKQMHLKDLPIGMGRGRLWEGKEDFSSVIGQGQLNIPAILKAMKQSSIESCFIEDESPKYLEHLPESLKFLNSLTY